MMASEWLVRGWIEDQTLLGGDGQWIPNSGDTTSLKWTSFHQRGSVAHLELRQVSDPAAFTLRHRMAQRASRAVMRTFHGEFSISPLYVVLRQRRIRSEVGRTATQGRG
jgi:hypothetical protein